jgi:hypothetical protein
MASYSVVLRSFVSVFSRVFGRKALKIKRVWNFTKVYRHKHRRQCTDFCLKNALKLTYVHLKFENFSGVNVFKRSRLYIFYTATLTGRTTGESGMRSSEHTVAHDKLAVSHPL